MMKGMGYEYLDESQVQDTIQHTIKLSDNWMYNSDGNMVIDMRDESIRHKDVYGYWPPLEEE